MDNAKMGFSAIVYNDDFGKRFTCPLCGKPFTKTSDYCPNCLKKVFGASGVSAPEPVAAEPIKQPASKPAAPSAPVPKPAVQPTPAPKSVIPPVSKSEIPSAPRPAKTIGAEAVINALGNKTEKPAKPAEKKAEAPAKTVKNSIPEAPRPSKNTMPEVSPPKKAETPEQAAAVRASSSKTVCPKCGHTVISLRFCSDCGAKLR